VAASGPINSCTLSMRDAEINSVSHNGQEWFTTCAKEIASYPVMTK